MIGKDGKWLQAAFLQASRLSKPLGSNVLAVVKAAVGLNAVRVRNVEDFGQNQDRITRLIHTHSQAKLALL